MKTKKTLVGLVPPPVLRNKAMAATRRWLTLPMALCMLPIISSKSFRCSQLPRARSSLGRISRRNIATGLLMMPVAPSFADDVGSKILEKAVEEKSETMELPGFIGAVFDDLKTVSLDDWLVVPPREYEFADPYPEWLLGTWRISGKFSNVEFPFGRGAFPERAAGARRMSVGFLPNIGVDVKDYQMRFVKDSEGHVEPDWEFNMEQSIPAFWKEARMTGAKYRASTDDNTPNKMTVEYTGPTRKYKEVSQACAMNFVEQDTYQINDDIFVVLDSVQQENFEQSVTTRWTHVRSYEKRTDGNVLSRMRVFSFADPIINKEAFENAKGKPVAIFEYFFLLKPVKEA